ncbi:phage major capsid protein [Clostridium novyi]|uniref:phage major capsid protein n=1 Tax=Clostridium novyi TaxID=1542 RepID=UPI0004D8108E|nr:phage major capsid protein [Clostridium novyi]KEH88878.1 phage major capsid protein, HK97 family [Clostridium novyi A str. GD211209]
MNLEQLLKQAEEKRKALVDSIDGAKNKEELDTIELDLRKQDIVIKDLKQQIAERDANKSQSQNEPQKSEEPQNSQGNSEEPDKRSGENPEWRSDKGITSIPNGGFKPLNSYGLEGAAKRDSEADIFNTLEYRKAFMDYVVKGTPIPQKFNEQRSSSITTVSDIGAVIPTNIMDKVIQEATSTGMILPRVFQTNFKAGIEIPISDIKPTATWIGEDKTSDVQKVKADKRLIFKYHTLECRVGLSLLSETITLPVFETTVQNNIKEAMIRALEIAIINGSGTGQPLGITKETIPEDRQIELSGTNIGTIAGWSQVEAAMPLAYESQGVYLMAKATWEKYLNGATDKNGQKLGFTNITSKLQRMLNGREVILTDYLPSFDAASEGNIFAVLVNLNEYLLNSNLAMTYKRYFDEDTNKWIHKSLMIADGKMGDKGGLVLIKKAAK